MLRYYADQDSLPSTFPDKTYMLGRVQHVIDGDTLMFTPLTLRSLLNPNVHQKSKIKLRLAGIDAPEIATDDKEGQPFATESREFLGQTLHKIILIQPFSKDQYGRLIGMIYDFPFLVPWIKRNLCLESLKKGLSVVYHGIGSQYGGLKQTLLSAQDEASRKRIGIWSLESFESPGITRVGDGDGFRLVHHPRIPLIRYSNTLSVRLAGVDAPEMGHFGKTPQPFSQEAKDWLKEYLEGHVVSVKLLEMDQYERIIGSVVKKLWIIPVKRNVSLEMVKQGLACVYEGSLGSFDGRKDQLAKAEQEAKRKKKGMWAQSRFESPMEYKKRTKA